MTCNVDNRTTSPIGIEYLSGELRMDREALFRGYPAPSEQVHPFEVSPSPLAGYVLGELPSDLASVRAGTLTYDGLRDRQEALLNDSQYLITGNDDEYVALVTQLDLAFMLGGYLPLGDDAYDSAPGRLLELLDDNAERFGLSARMDYELVIDTNAEEYNRHGHIRTFLDGDAALSERDFYLGHFMSEQYIKAAAEGLRQIVKLPDIAERNELLREAADHMRSFRDCMARYAGLSRGDFRTSRQYSTTYPDGTRNASGAFMPSVQLAELLLHAPTEEQLSYIKEAMDYFPRWSRDPIRDWCERSARGENIIDMLSQGQLQLTNAGLESLKALVEEFIQFRKTHWAVTRKQLPEVFESRDIPVSTKQFARFGEPRIIESRQIGTAGFDVVSLLGGTVYRLLAIQEKLDGGIEPAEASE